MTASGVSGPTLSKGLGGSVQGVRLAQLNPSPACLYTMG